MTRFRQRCQSVWGSAQTQDLAEYAVMLAVILLLVIGTLKLMGKHNAVSLPTPAPAGATK